MLSALLLREAGQRSLGSGQMSQRLTTAVRIGAAARQILNKTRSFPDIKIGGIFDLDSDHIGAEPMLLALSMELALKAWFVFDYDDPKIWGHDLVMLFDSLTEESQQKLDFAFKASIAPVYPSGIHLDYGLRHLLYQYKDAFKYWRYLHQRKETLRFERSEFEATLEMVLSEFEKRYRTERVVQP
jgi:hypothetical protein